MMPMPTPREVEIASGQHTGRRAGALLRGDGCDHGGRAGGGSRAHGGGREETRFHRGRDICDRRASGRKLFNSRGPVMQWHRQSSAEASITMIGGNSSGWQKANSPNAMDFDAGELAEIAAAQKARLSADPIDIPAGKYTRWILEPAAVLDLVGSCSGISAGWRYWTSGRS